jgi:hypothetical protein
MTDQLQCGFALLVEAAQRHGYVNGTIHGNRFYFAVARPGVSSVLSFCDCDDILKSEWTVKAISKTEFQLSNYRPCLETLWRQHVEG